MRQCREVVVHHIAVVAAGEIPDRMTANQMAAHLHLAEGYVSRIYGIEPQELYAPNRAPGHVVDARRLVMYLARVELGMSVGDVSRRYRRDRTTVALACRTVEELREDPIYDLMVCEIEQLVTLRDDYFFMPFSGAWL
ncbi:helix-turn-helix domain-containing protein [Roseibium sp.]|uniref:helix-turn-helix domain-containing protein n=1 Tax=Roseibium sp. TaxID=1936156 RepID=UPI003A9703A9